MILMHKVRKNLKYYVYLAVNDIKTRKIINIQLVTIVAFLLLILLCYFLIEMQ